MNDIPDDILNLDSENVFLLHTTDRKIRAFLDAPGELSDEVASVFDEAQGYVFTDEGSSAYIVIKVSKGKESA